MRTIVIAGAALMAAVSAQEAAAQGRITVDARAALAMPTGDFGTTELGTALGFGATVALRVQQHVHLYGGWDWLPFSADEVVGGDLTFVETGFTFGLRFEHAIRAGGRAGYRLEGGGTFKAMKIENDGGSVVGESDSALGFELGAGLVLPLGERLRVTPGLRFRSVSHEFETGPLTTTSTLRYVGLELGLSMLF